MTELQQPPEFKAQPVAQKLEEVRQQNEKAWIKVMDDMEKDAQGGTPFFVEIGSRNYKGKDGKTEDSRALILKSPVLDDKDNSFYVIVTRIGALGISTKDSPNFPNIIKEIIEAGSMSNYREKYHEDPNSYGLRSDTHDAKGRPALAFGNIRVPYAEYPDSKAAHPMEDFMPYVPTQMVQEAITKSRKLAENQSPQEKLRGLKQQLSDAVTLKLK